MEAAESRRKSACVGSSRKILTGKPKPRQCTWGGPIASQSLVRESLLTEQAPRSQRGDLSVILVIVTMCLGAAVAVTREGFASIGLREV